ncbi:MAG TPA: hypothetical protein VHN13_20680 [Candidatus Tectomicrobia bacterium]|nr:hypothetical protein [Candidatus Tectomicrobia bacterium]
MNRREKVLYHQIHPLKLVTDASAGGISYYFLWRHRLRLALAVQLLPAIVVSFALIQWADLEPYERSRFGQYVRRHMTRRMEAVRLLGNVVVSIGAWYRRPALMGAGLLIVLFGWAKGKLWG